MLSKMMESLTSSHESKTKAKAGISRIYRSLSERQLTRPPFFDNNSHFHSPAAHEEISIPNSGDMEHSPVSHGSHHVSLIIQ